MTIESKTSVVEHIALTLWVGGMWTIGYVSVPILFSVLEDRHMAGSLAAPMFSAINYIGLACAVLILIGMFYRYGTQCLGSWRCWVVTTMVVLIIVGQFILHPMMEDIRAEGLVESSNLARQFGQLHGISTILYMVSSLLGLVLVIFGLHRKE
jgi:fatty acid desaturase